MTITTATRKAGPFIGNDSATAFPFEFKVFSADDLLVVYTDTAMSMDSNLVLNTDFTVVLNPDQNANPGGTVTLTAGALATGFNLTITSDIEPLQATDLTNQGGFYPQVVTNALDKLTILIQQLFDKASRALTLPVSTPAGVSAELPVPESNKLIGWNEAASGLQNFDSSLLATLVAYGTANADLFSGDDVTTAFVLSDNPGALNNLDVSIGGVTQTPGVDYTWSSGLVINFTSPPPLGTDNILVRYMQGLPTGTGVSSQIAHTPAGVGAVATTVETQLKFIQENWVNVKDAPFYAAGDGVTDDTAAIQAAIDSSEALWIPPGTYRITSRLVFDPSKACRRFVGAGSTLVTFDASAYSSANAAFLVSGNNIDVFIGLQMGGFTVDAGFACDGMYVGGPAYATHAVLQATFSDIRLVNAKVDNLALSYVTTSSFDEVVCQQGGTGRLLNCPVQANAILFKRCIFLNASSNLSQIFLSNCEGLEFDSCEFAEYTGTASMIGLFQSQAVIINPYFENIVNEYIASVGTAAESAIRKSSLIIEGGQCNVTNPRFFAYIDATLKLTGLKLISPGANQGLALLQFEDSFGFLPYKQNNIVSKNNEEAFVENPLFKIGCNNSNVQGVSPISGGGTWSISKEGLLFAPVVSFAGFSVSGITLSANTKYTLVLKMSGLPSEAYMNVGNGLKFLTLAAETYLYVPFITGGAPFNLSFTFVGNPKFEYFAIYPYHFVGGVSAPYEFKPKIFFATAAPSTASNTNFEVGDVVFNAIPSIGAPKGWRCTVAGTPGTWVSEGNL